MQSQSVPFVVSDAHKSTIIIDGPPSSGKSTRGKKIADLLNFEFFDMGEYLRKNVDAEEIRSIMRSGKYVPDNQINLILKRQVMKTKGKSQVLVGVRTVPQAQELHYTLLNFEHKIIYLRLDRSYEDCLDLMSKGRDREDDKVEVFDTRWGIFEQHTHNLENFFRSRPTVGVLRYSMTRSIEHDRLEILRLIQPYCGNFSLPAITEEISSGVSVSVQ